MKCILTIILIFCTAICAQTVKQSDNPNNVVFDSWYSGELFGAKAIAMHNLVRKINYQGKSAYESNVYYKMKISRGEDHFESTTKENILVFDDMTPISSVSKSVEGEQKTIVTTIFSGDKITRQTQVDGVIHEEFLQTDKKIILDETTYIYWLINQGKLQKDTVHSYTTLNEETLQIETETLKVLSLTSKQNKDIWEIEVKSTEHTFSFKMYADSHGEIVAIVIPGINIKATRTTREQAEIFDEELSLDIMFPTNVVVPNENDVTQMELFINTNKMLLKNNPYQTVEKTKEGVNVILNQHSPEVVKNYVCDEKDSKKFDIYLAPQPLIQCESTIIVEKAKEIIPENSSTYTSVKYLQKWVYENLKKSSTSTANASSIATLKTMAGDCTEHANLFCALARSLKIPTRVCGGLVYLEGEFGLHAWNEVYLGKWLVVDCALNRLGSNGKYIFFNYDYEKDGSDLIMNMLATRPQIKIINVWNGVKKINMDDFIKSNDKWVTTYDPDYKVNYVVNNLWTKSDHSTADERVVQYVIDSNTAIIYNFFGCSDYSLEELQPVIANHIGKNFASWNEEELLEYSINGFEGQLGLYDTILEGEKVTVEIFYGIRNKVFFNIRIIYLSSEEIKYRDKLAKSLDSFTVEKNK
ncbi:transglutaminase family protein [Candidatus Uabimicrobium sp. HlEnr_7]|uniref:transglutaminase-like domain-containing protein n=1 Tax=Candidatus Uabimicrobium helgolandensis TaxID=3095367 RepID=UPI0035580C1C